MPSIGGTASKATMKNTGFGVSVGYRIGGKK
jgi:hypothetical protein